MDTLLEMRRLALAALLLAALGLAAASVLLSRGGEPERRPVDTLGVTVSATDHPARLMIDSLRSDGVARRAGLRVGDVVERVNGHDVTSQMEFVRTISSQNPIDIRVRRGENDVDVMIVIGPGGRIGEQDPLDRGRQLHG